MNVKLQIGELKPLFDENMIELSSKLEPLAQQARLTLIEPQAGMGYLQWSLPGNDWISFTKMDDVNKAIVAKVFKERCDALLALLEGSSLHDNIIKVPSSDYIFFRKNNLEWEVALAAWGYKFVDKLVGDDLSSWIEEKEHQSVRLGFQWDGKLLPNLPFLLNTFPRITANDGMFLVGESLEVGEIHKVETKSGKIFQLEVEKGKAEYLYDLTQWVNVEVKVSKDGAAQSGQPCELAFNGNKWQLFTDEVGCARHRMPLVCNIEGDVLQPQPNCIVICEDAIHQQTPSFDNETLHFNFTFFTPKYVVVKVSVTKDGVAMVDQACNLSFNGSDYHIKTDESGLASVKMPLVGGQDGKVLDPQPECIAICASETQKAAPSANGETLLFNFVFITPPDPKFVKFRLLDYGGYPMPDLPFKLTTKKKGEQTLRTDENGYCQVPQEWFSDKEKMRIKVLISPEYQEKHELHSKKK